MAGVWPTALRILPPLTVADLGAGEGLLSELLARRAKKVIAVDNSERIVAFGAAKAKKERYQESRIPAGRPLNRHPIDKQSVDLVVLSQALHHAQTPSRAIAAAHNLLKPARRQIMILDLLKHNFEQAKELYGDTCSAFAESDLHRWLEAAGFQGKSIFRWWPARSSRPTFKHSCGRRKNDWGFKGYGGEIPPTLLELAIANSTGFAVIIDGVFLDSRHNVSFRALKIEYEGF
jgi:SAM-dependent methyltransferase